VYYTFAQILIMKNKNTKTVLLVIGLTMAFQSFSQQNTVSSGGVASGNGGTSAYSIGQVVYEYKSGSAGNMNEGVQQPYEIYDLGITESGLNFQLSVYPNPTSDVLNLSINNYSTEQLRLELIDNIGKLLKTSAISSKLTAIEIGSLPNAIYYINVLQEDKLVQSFKIVKN